MHFIIAEGGSIWIKKNLSDVLSIGSNAFAYSKIDSVSINANLSIIQEATFFGCSNLKGITLPNTLKTISKNAFFKCAQNEGKGIYTCEIPRSVITIEDGAFSSCKYINFKIPASVTNIGKDAFYGIGGKIDCAEESYASEYLKKNNIEYSTYNDEVTTQGITFQLMSSGGKRTACITKYSNTRTGGIDIPNTISFDGLKYTITEIGAEAFAYTKISYVYVPDTVTRINSGVFKACRSLREVRIPESVNQIFGNIFEGANEDITIYGKAGSAAEKNAKTYGREKYFHALGTVSSNPTNMQIKEPDKDNQKSKSTTDQSGTNQEDQPSQKSNNSTQPAKVYTDTTIPSTSNYTFSTTSGWCKQNTVKFNLTDNSGLSYVEIKLGDTVVYKYNNFGNSTSYKIPYTAKKNGTYKIYASDKKGNSGEVGSFYIPNIDDKLPTVQCQISPKDTWSLNKVINFTLQDNYGLKSYKIYFKNKVIKQGNISGKTFSDKFTAEKNGAYLFEVYDEQNLGGKIYRLTINSIDNVKPTVTDFSYSAPSWWCKENTVKFKISDNLGISSYKITYNGKTVQTQKYTNSPKNVQISYNATKNGKYKIYVTDTKGLKSKKSWFILSNIDDRRPTIENIVINPNNQTKSKSKTVTMNLSDVGLGVEKYILTKNKDDVKNKNKYINLTSNVYDSKTKQFKKVFDESGIYYFAVMDKNGNISKTKKIKIVNVDKTSPEIRTAVVTKNEGALKNSTYYLKNNSKLEIKLKFTEKVASIDKSKIKVNGTVAEKVTVDAKLSDDKKYCIITVKGASNVTDANKGYISIESGFLTDLAGNKSTQSIVKLKKMIDKKESDIIYFALDNSGPNIELNYDADNAKVTANITDLCAGIAEYQWLIEEAGVTGKIKSGNKATKLEKILTLGKNNGKTVKLRVKDTLGNETTKEVSAPISVKTYYIKRENNIVTFKIKFNVPAQIDSSLKSSLKNSKFKDCRIEDLKPYPNDTSGTRFELTVNTNGSNKSTNIYIPKGTIYVNSPQNSEEKDINIYVDNENPTITIGELPDKKCTFFYLSYIAHDTNGIKKIQYSRNGKVLKTISVNTTGDYNGTINVIKNGEITISAWDYMGNKTDYNVTIDCIDNKAPVIKNIKYSKPDDLGNVEVTIVANESISANDWNNTNEKTIKRTYQESDLQGSKVAASRVTIRDEAGNRIYVTLEDKIAPSVVGEIQKTVQTNGNTKVIINLSEPIQYTKELQDGNWTLSNNEKQLTKVVSANEEIMVTDLAGNDIEESIKIEVEQTQKFFLNTVCEPNDKVTPTTVFTKTISTSKDIKSVDLQNLTGKVDCEISNDKRSFTITYHQSVQTKEQIKVTDIDNEVHKIHINRLVNVVKKGDSNNDGIITQDDYEIMNRNVARTEKETNQYKVFAMDMNDDGKIDIKDLSLLKKLL